METGAHRDVVVELRLVVCLAHRAVVVVVDRPQAAEAADDAGAHRAEQQPVHGEHDEQERDR